MAFRRVEAVRVKPQRCGQRRELRGDQGAKRSQGRFAVEPGAHRRDLGDTPSEPVGKQSDDDHQDVMNPLHPAPHPSHRARKCDRIGAKRVRRCEKARARSACATTSSSSSNVPGSRAARKSGNRLNVVWLWGQYQRAMRVPRGVLRA